MKSIKEPPNRVLQAMLGVAPAAPSPTEELQHFINYNEACSATLKKES